MTKRCSSIEIDRSLRRLWRRYGTNGSEAARPEQAEPLYRRFCDALAGLGVPVQTGVFGARMEVELVKDGPVASVLEV